MSPALKAALLSGLVWPGLGQAVLGRRRRAAAFALATLGCLAVMVVLLVRLSLRVLADVQVSGGSIETATIAAAVHAAAAEGATLGFRAALVVLALIWIAGVVDGWRCGGRGPPDA